MIRSFRMRAGALVTLAAMTGGPAGALASPAAVARTVAGHRLGDVVTDFAALPVADHGGADVVEDSDRLTTDQLVAVNHAQRPGYRAAAIHLSGTALRLELLYLPEGSTEGVVVERTGTLHGNRIALASSGTVRGLIRAVSPTLYEFTSAAGVLLVPMENPVSCFLTVMGILLAGLVCVAAAPTGVIAAGCIASMAALQTGYVISSTDCNAIPADLEPEFQTVTGQGPGTGGRAQFQLTGSTRLETHRSLIVVFATCSACGSFTTNTQSGTSAFYYSPLGCDQTQTEWGTVYYPNNYQSDSVQVTINNPTPGC